MDWQISPSHSRAEYFMAEIKTSVYEIAPLYFEKKSITLIRSKMKPHEAEKSSKIKTRRR